MSDQAAVVKPAPQMKLNQALIVGRIDHVRTYPVKGKKVFETRIVQPAPDQYSSPSAVAVQSENRLGDVDEDVRVLVHVGGYKDNYKTRPDEDGEVKTVTTARNVLRAVE